MGHREHVSALRELIEQDRVREAILYLNRLTPHRFTGVYIFDDPQARNSMIIDEENPELESLPDVPMTATYCSFTKPDGVPLVIVDSLTDQRFEEHPARNEVRAYCGVPMVSEFGEVFGTVCHFDFRQIPIEESVVRLMEAVGPIFSSRISGSAA